MNKKEQEIKEKINMAIAILEGNSHFKIKSALIYLKLAREQL